MTNVTSSSRPHVSAVAAGVALAVSLTACQSLNEIAGGDKVDYRGAASRTRPLEVPPDLTQLTPDTRFQPPASRGAVSASEFQTAATTPNATPGVVAPSSAGDVRIERLRDQRYIVTPQTPEQVWPILQSFWQERSLALTVDKPNAGVMETEWAENRALLPADWVRRTLGKVVPVLFSTNTLDKFRVRVERNPAGGSEIYLTHSGLEEFFRGPMKENSTWEPRPRDYQVEAELLSLLMQKLGAKEGTATPAIINAPAPSQPAKARLVDGQPSATLQVDDTFDRAWRRVGLSLDRSGFTVEDRDRAQGIYFVRYVDPKSAGREEPGFLSRWFGGKKDDNAKALVRYRVVVKGAGELTTVTVQDASGAPENGEAGQRIVKFLVDDLK